VEACFGTNLGHLALTDEFEGATIPRTISIRIDQPSHPSKQLSRLSNGRVEEVNGRSLVGSWSGRVGEHFGP